MVERGVAPAGGTRNPVPGRPRVTVRPHYEGLPRVGWTGQDERGESRALGAVKSRPSESRKHGPEAQNRRGEAPRGVPVRVMGRRSRTFPGQARPQGGPRGAAFRTSACRRFAPSHRGARSKARPAPLKGAAERWLKPLHRLFENRIGICGAA